MEIANENEFINSLESPIYLISESDFEESKQKIISKIVEIAKKYPVKKINLFGSYARGDYKENSDVDMILIDDDELHTVNYIYDLWDEMESALGLSVDILTSGNLRTMSKYMLENINDDMRCIYEVS